MKIQEFSRLSGLSAKTIRYYESIGILPSPPRTSNGYRDYGEKDFERARFVAGIRSLDLSLDEIAEILAMRDRREHYSTGLNKKWIKSKNEFGL
jgi:DNA-binding transcriptional MerR regulator